MEKYKIIIIILGIGMMACQNKRQYLPVNIDAVDIKIERFDSAILQLDTAHIQADVEKMYSTKEEMMHIYVENILGFDTEDTTYLCAALKDFIGDTAYHFNTINATEQATFADISDIEEELGKAFARIQILNPNWEIPQVYGYVSGLNLQKFYYNSILGIGLDCYLGSDFPYYNQAVYHYEQITMSRNYITRDAIETYLTYHLPYIYTQNRLIDRMIHSGKQLFILHAILPELADSIVIGYSDEQYRWAIKYEQQIWNTIMDKKDLFKVDFRTINSYINPAPFTGEISQESPGRLGEWVGWRIVESYMVHHPQITLQELMNIKSAQMILEQSQYKP